MGRRTSKRISYLSLNALMLREILKIYKENNTTRNKNEVEDYSIIIHIPEKEGFTKEKYQKYADKITNDDIMIIINDLYNIQA